MENIIPKSVNPDIQKERDGASFKAEEFATWWHGGPEMLQKKRKMRAYLLEGMNEEEKALLYYKSHEEMYEISVRQAIDVAKKLRQLQDETNPGGSEIWPKLFDSAVSWAAMPLGNPFSVHYVMLLKALQTQATPEQFEEFGRRVERFEVCGTYAQTELGHGSNLRALQTRADYVRETEEFVLNSPTLTAYKWWPGGLGHSCNYCLIAAQLYIDDEPKGLHMFYVQIRDEQTHRPLPGIDVGEIGKKIGFLGVNNGYLGLKNVRVPRTRMLMRNAKVLADGTYIKSPAQVLTYFTMVYVRCIIAQGNAHMLLFAATIATRYAAVRRQGNINHNEPEVQIMDHITQQLKLFPVIATGIANSLSANYMWELYDQTYSELQRGVYTRLPEMHALSCVMKAIATRDSSTGSEQMRLACGGHGYLTSANLAMIQAATTAACTYEGENTVLFLQVGRFLIKSWRAALEGKPLVPTVAYLAAAQTQPNFAVAGWTGSWQHLVNAMQFVAANKTRLAFESIADRIQNGESEGVATNHTGIEIVQAAELHGRAFICATFLRQVTQDEKVKKLSPALQKVLHSLLELYLVNTALNNMGDILRFINLSDAHVSALQRRLESVLKAIRPNAVTIVDGLDIMDAELNSTLGSYDGNVYERLYHAAQQSPLNRQVVPKAFHEHLKPFLKSNM